MRWRRWGRWRQGRWRRRRNYRHTNYQLLVVSAHDALIHRRDGWLPTPIIIPLAVTTSTEERGSRGNNQRQHGHTTAPSFLFGRQVGQSSSSIIHHDAAQTGSGAKERRADATEAVSRFGSGAAARGCCCGPAAVRMAGGALAAVAAVAAGLSPSDADGDIIIGGELGRVRRQDAR